MRDLKQIDGHGDHNGEVVCLSWPDALSVLERTARTLSHSIEDMEEGNEEFITCLVLLIKTSNRLFRELETDTGGTQFDVEIMDHYSVFKCVQTEIEEIEEAFNRKFNVTQRLLARLEHFKQTSATVCRVSQLEAQPHRREVLSDLLNETVALCDSIENASPKIRSMTLEIIRESLPSLNPTSDADDADEGYFRSPLRQMRSPAVIEPQAHAASSFRSESPLHSEALISVANISSALQIHTDMRGEGDKRSQLRRWAEKTKAAWIGSPVSKEILPVLLVRLQ